MSTEHDVQDRPADLLEKMQAEAIHRFELELDDLRTTMAAMAACCEQSMTRLRDARWVPYDAASRLVEEVTAAADAERSEAGRLAQDLAAAREEIERVREQCRVEVEAAHDEAARQSEEAVGSCQRELEEARALAQLAMEAELKVREELTAVRARNQEIIDAQMLRLLEFKRELGLGLSPAEANGARAVDETPASEPVGPVAVPQPVHAEIIPPLEPDRHRHAPEFSAIEAVLAGSPPVAAWERSA
jgi:hypothetical protein